MNYRFFYITWLSKISIWISNIQVNCSIRTMKTMIFLLETLFSFNLACHGSRQSHFPITQAKILEVIFGSSLSYHTFNLSANSEASYFHPSCFHTIPCLDYCLTTALPQWTFNLRRRNLVKNVGPCQFTVSNLPLTSYHTILKPKSLWWCTEPPWDQLFAAFLICSYRAPSLDSNPVTLASALFFEQTRHLPNSGPQEASLPIPSAWSSMHIMVIEIFVFSISCCISRTCNTSWCEISD